VAEEGEAPGLDPAEERRHRRGLKFRKRDDYAVELLQEIRAHLEDLPRVRRALFELGRLYNPYIDGPIVDLPTRQRIVGLLEGGRATEARDLLDERLRLYTGPGSAGPGATGPGGMEG
jgi:hypothetical protein